MLSLPLSLQARDLALLRGLFECRVMTAKHIATLYFDGKREATKKRLQKLKTAGLISERQRRAYEPSILFLTRRGLTILQEKGILAEYPAFHIPALDKRANVSEINIHHELDVMDVKAAFHSAIKSVGRCIIAEFSTWPRLYEFRASRGGYGGQKVDVEPDGFIRIHETERDGGLSEHTFFLEVDRSTKTQDALVSQAGCYLDYFKSGGFAVKNGGTRSAYKEFPFRVLMVFKTPERRNNTAERLLQKHPGILTHVCLSTFKEVTINPFGAVWIRPIDYSAATKGTPFDPERHRETYGYKRQTARELHVESKIKKLSLLA